MKDSRITCWLILVATLLVASTGLAQQPHGRHALPKVHDHRALDIDTLRHRFANPPREAGPWVYWFWFDNVLNRSEISRQLEEMADAGIAGAELRCVVGRGFPSLVAPWYGPDAWARLEHKQLEYLSPEFIEVMEHTCAEAELRGIRLAMNLGMGWPPGGPWIPDEHRSKHLQSSSRIVTGPRVLAKGELAAPAGAMVFAWRLQPSEAGSQVVPDSFRDLTGNVDVQHHVSWDVPEGQWLIGVFHHTYGGMCDKGNGPEADPGSREAVLFHLDHIFSRLEPKLAKYFGTTFVEVASDSWEYTRPRAGRYWSPGLFAAYEAHTGTSLKSKMYALLGHGPDQDIILRDLEAAAREAVQGNFFETLTSYLHDRGLRHRPQVRGRGLPRDFFDAYASADVPEIEEEVCLPEAIWTAHILGKPIISAEAFTFLSGHAGNLSMHPEPRHGSLYDPQRLWETTPALMRQHANAHFARGINRIQIHSYSYSPPQVPAPGWRMYAEIHLNRNVPWWWAMPEFSRWVARNQLMLQSGGPVADAVVYPVRANRPDGPFNKATDQPTSALNAVDGVSPSIFARVKKLSGDVSYDFRKLVFLDDVRTLDEARHIADLVTDGVTLVCCRAMPEEWSVFEGAQDSDASASLLEQLGKAPVVDARADGWQKALRDSQSVRWTSEADITYQHRRVEDGEIYFLMNWGDDFEGDVSFPDKGWTPELWDADTGTTRVLGVSHRDDDRVHLSVSLRRLESAFVVFSRSGPAPRVAASQSTERRLASSVEISGAWTLTAAPADGVGLDTRFTRDMDKLASWREIPKLERFAGTVTYTTSFAITEERLREASLLRLGLGQVREVARVWLNGRAVGTTWHSPHCLVITEHVRSGKNELRIQVANILKNHFEQSSAYGRPSGLLGPVQIEQYTRLELNE